MENWTTRLNPELSRRYGVAELHNVFFEPEGWGGVVSGVPAPT